MDKRTRLIFNAIIYFSLLFTSIMAVLSNSEKPYIIFLLCVFLFISFTVRRILPEAHMAGKLTLLLDIGLIYLITLSDKNEFSQIFFYSLVSDAMILYYHKFSIFFSSACYISYIFIIYARYIKNNYFDISYFFPVFMEKSFFFIFVFGVMYIASYQINQKLLFNKTLEELETKTLQLEESNKKLHETMEALEEVTALKERNRIAREIHDTVGHALTTVLIEIEAGKRLIKKGMESGFEKLELAQEQVRKGINDIRSSVRMLQVGNEVMGFIPSLRSLVQETEMHTGVSVKCLFSPLPKLDPELEKILYRALQEGLTNGIRHGRSTSFACAIRCQDGRVLFTLKDNGAGSDEIILGFGLTSMKERVEKRGGIFRVESEKGKGFCLSLDIPVKEENHETHSNFDS
jgi:signal transduction histidine kinase